MPSEHSTLILGGGISGLALAYRLQKSRRNVILLEGSERLGGWIRTERCQGFLFEKGPRSLRMAGAGQATLSLAKELDLENEIIHAQGKNRYLWWEGKLHRVPSHPLKLLTSPLMRGCRNALLKEWRVPRYEKEDESIGHFFIRRFNKTLLDRLIDPLVTGIYGGSFAELSIRSCFPHLWHLEQKHGSVIRGLMKSKRSGHGLFSFRGGLERLVERLVERLEIEVRLNCPVEQIRCERDRVEVEAGGEHFVAEQVYSALPPRTLERLTRAPKVPTQSIGVVNVGYHQKVLPHEGFGYLIPSAEMEPILGAVWDSSIFPQQNESDEETRMTVMMTEPNVEVAVEALERHMGISAKPDATSAYLAEDAIPQYNYGHSEKIRRMERDLPKRLTILGSSFYGVSVNDCIAGGLADGSPP